MKRHTVVLAVTLVFMASAGGALIASVVAGPPGMILGVMGVMSLGVVSAPVLIRREFDPFEPLIFVILTVAVGVGLKIPYLALVEGERVGEFLMLGRSLEFFVPAALAVLVGLASFVVGYHMRFPLPRVGLGTFFSLTTLRRQRLMAVMTLCAVLPLTAIWAYAGRMQITFQTFADLSQKRLLEVGVSTGQFRIGGALGYYRWAASLSGIACLAGIFQLTQKAPRRVSVPLFLVTGVLGTIALVIPILSSTRMDVVLLCLSALAVFHYGGGKLTAVRTASVLAVLLLVFLGLTAMRGGPSSPAVLGEAVSSDLLVDETVGSRHFLDLTKTALIMDAVPHRLPYEHGATFLNWMTAPIPRTLWPEKPALGSGPIIGPVVFGTGGAGVPPGLIAELHMNFGWMGIPLGMWIAGVIVRSYYRAVDPLRGGAGRVLLYGATVIPVSYYLLNLDVSKAIVSSLLAAIPMVILVGIVGVRPSRLL